VLPEAKPLTAEGAIDRRLDVLAARAAAKAALGELKLRTGLRLWRDINIEAVGESEGNGEWSIGHRLEIALPIFNQGRPQVSAAAAAALRAEHARAAVEQGAASEIRIGRVAFKQAEQRLERYRKEVLPLHDEIVELKLKEYNYMLVGAFEVLTARQSAAQAQVGYVESLRDYWKARVALDSALGGGTPAGLIVTEATP
jgi:cobalt-zinc-cadmium efflux system outer membrane protein